jgi:hypothetical protein
VAAVTGMSQRSRATLSGPYETSLLWTPVCLALLGNTVRHVQPWYRWREDLLLSQALASDVSCKPMRHHWYLPYWCAQLSARVSLQRCH